MGHEYRILQSDLTAARAEALTLAARQSVDVQPDEVFVIGAAPLEEDDETLGWLVSVGLG